MGDDDITPGTTNENGPILESGNHRPRRVVDDAAGGTDVPQAAARALLRRQLANPLDVGSTSPSAASQSDADGSTSEA